MPTFTSNYSLDKPLVGSAVDENLWGGQLNGNMDDIDGLLRVGITIPVQTSQTGNFNVSSSISLKYLYPCDATGGAFTATMPLAASAGLGATVFIRKTDASANAVNIARSGSDTLDGGTSLSITNENGCFGLVSDGVDKWISVCKPVVVPTSSTTQAGIVELATAAETLTGTDATRAITPAAFAGNKSLAGNGYYKLPSGLILQWGTAAQIGTNATSTVNFPITFSNLYSVTITGQSTTLIAGSAYLHSAPTNASFTWRAAGGPFALQWQAVGI